MFYSINGYARSVNDIMRKADAMLSNAAERDDGSRVVDAPTTFMLSNPLARFPIGEGAEDLAARCVAESIYFLSGIDSGEFIWEFRGWDDPRKRPRADAESLGRALRFHGPMSPPYSQGGMTFARAAALRHGGMDMRNFTDWFPPAVERLKLNPCADVFIPLADALNPLDALGLWLHAREGALDMQVSCGILDCCEGMAARVLSPLAFFQQVIADAAGFRLGRMTISAGCLYRRANPDRTFIMARSRSPDIARGMNEFHYPCARLSPRDIDTLVAMTIEFASRLDERSVSRANPLDGDDRARAFSDCAEVIRAWEARRMGRDDVRGMHIAHPQLRRMFGEKEDGE